MWQCTSPVYPITGSDIVGRCAKKGSCDARTTAYIHTVSAPGCLQSSEPCLLTSRLRVAPWVFGFKLFSFSDSMGSVNLVPPNTDSTATFHAVQTGITKPDYLVFPTSCMGIRTGWRRRVSMTLHRAPTRHVHFRSQDFGQQNHAVACLVRT